jgi:hypothetical protein
MIENLVCPSVEAPPSVYSSGGLLTFEEKNRLRRAFVLAWVDMGTRRDNSQVQTIRLGLAGYDIGIVRDGKVQPPTAGWRIMHQDNNIPHMIESLPRHLQIFPKGIRRQGAEVVSMVIR